MSISFCLKCTKSVDDTLELCDCGSTSFVFSKEDNAFSFDSKGNVLCSCGESNFQKKMHLDYTDKHVTTYICANCSCSVGVEVYRNEEDIMY